MMGIKGDLDMDTESKITSEKKKYILVRNHVREIPSIDVDETSSETTQKVNEVKVKKNQNKSSSSSSDSENSASEISENDLNELRNAYDKCKTVIKKIESKYGHLLQIDRQGSSRRKNSVDSTECRCSLKRKIVYDDEGKQVYQNVAAEHHICLSSVKKKYKGNEHSPEPLNVSIEDETSYELPDSLQALAKMLQEQKLSNHLKYKVMKKIKSIRQDHMNTLHYEKPNLVKKLKSNMRDIFDFEGSNLFSLPGYPVD